MKWTTSADLRAQVLKLWDKGDLLRALVSAQPLPPLRLRLSGPVSSDLSERFDSVRTWLDALRGTPRVRIVWREFRHRVLGQSALPHEIWLDTQDDALALAGKQKEAHRFTELLQRSQAHDPALFAALTPWLAKRPLSALALADVWPRLLAVVSWLQRHPRPGIYLRLVDLPGIDSKFIEAHRGVLSELLDLALPTSAVDQDASGINQFCRRYGFRDKPLRLRLRLLDASLALLGSGFDQDITLTQRDFEALAPPVQRVFITENEVNFLAFPPMSASLVIFGAGYGFDALTGAAWLKRCQLFYWGDIDTHGFAILDQLRAHFPQAQSLLMDQATLLAHAGQWGSEPQPLLRDLPRLSADEAAVFNDLRTNRLRPNLRLEQERIGFGALQSALASIEPPRQVRMNLAIPLSCALTASTDVALSQAP
ncbi:MAG TPA: DUF2220 family protein [Rhodoferax sp.]|nr:DUF2220 family protein [Rhodoferax sp.]